MITSPTTAGMHSNQTILPTASTTLVYSAHPRSITSGLRGVNTKPVEIGSYAHNIPLMLLIEFHPAGLFLFTDIEQNLLADYSCAFDDLNPILNNQISRLFEQTADISSLVSKLNQVLLASLGDHAMPDAMSAAMKLILSSGGILSSRQLAAEIFYSEKQLNRIFRRYIGTGIKSFSRIVRTKRALSFIEAGGKSLTCIAEQSGYYDVSHLIRDLKEVCGITPQQYLQKMSIFYSDPYKL